MADISANTTAVITMATSLLGLLAEFPLNLLVVGLVGGVAFKLIRGAKKVAK